MAIGRTVWGPKVPTLKGTEVSIVLCTMFLVSSSINVSIFHITWLNTFWASYTMTTFFFFFQYILLIMLLQWSQFFLPFMPLCTVPPLSPAYNDNILRFSSNTSDCILFYVPDYVFVIFSLLKIIENIIVATCTPRLMLLLFPPFVIILLMNDNRRKCTEDTFSFWGAPS